MGAAKRRMRISQLLKRKPKTGEFRPPGRKSIAKVRRGIAAELWKLGLPLRLLSERRARLLRFQTIERETGGHSLVQGLIKAQYTARQIPKPRFTSASDLAVDRPFQRWVN